MVLPFRLIPNGVRFRIGVHTAGIVEAELSPPDREKGSYMSHVSRYDDLFPKNVLQNQRVRRRQEPMPISLAVGLFTVVILAIGVLLGWSASILVRGLVGI
jgi:hypothetical protein